MTPKRFQKIYIEISNICNLQCDFCPEVERDKKVMGEALFSKIIKEAAPLTEEVCFHLMGEPLAHPQFERFIGICSQYLLPVNITTNGTLLKASKIDSLLHPIVRQVNFSLHSFQANALRTDLKSYLKPIVEFTQRALHERPDLYINYRLWNLVSQKDSQNQNEGTLTYLSDFFPLPPWDKIDVSHRKNKRITGRLFLHFDTRFDWPSLKAPQRHTEGFCYGLKSHVGIHADGTLVPCCLDKEAGINLGDCAKETLSILIEGERALTMREGFDKNILVEDLCKRCSFIDRFKGKIHP